MPAARGRADSGDIEIDLVELFTDAASVATDVGTGIALFIDEMQDVPADDVSALCAACHELSQTGAPLIVVGAGLPHLPAVLSASKSYSERLFRYQRIDRLDRLAADQALSAPAEREGVEFETEGAGRAVRDLRRLPVLRAGVRQGDLGPRAALADHAPPTCGSPRPRPRPSWRSGSSAPGTSGPRRPSGSTCARWPSWPTATTWTPPWRPPRSPKSLGRKPASLSPARDALIKKGLIYSGERGTVAFTVPHFGRYLRAQPVADA